MRWHWPAGFWRRIMRAGCWPLQHMLDSMLPHRCALCGVMVADGGGFCSECWPHLDFLGAPCCVQCQWPFDQAQGEGARCAGCLATPPPYQRARAPLAYGYGARQLVIGLKYGRRVGAARVMARLMQLAARDLLAACPEDPPPLLIPVPLHRWRLWWRGFNQSALLARHLARWLALPCVVGALRRRKATGSMRGLGRSARQRRVRGAFVVPTRYHARVAGRIVILVDDVLTTGATAGACCRALRRAGATQVMLLTFARVTEGRGRDPIDRTTPASDMSGHG